MYEIITRQIPDGSLLLKHTEYTAFSSPERTQILNILEHLENESDNYQSNTYYFEPSFTRLYLRINLIWQSKVRILMLCDLRISVHFLRINICLNCSLRPSVNYFRPLKYGSRDRLYFYYLVHRLSSPAVDPLLPSGAGGVAVCSAGVSSRSTGVVPPINVFVRSSCGSSKND